MLLGSPFGRKLTRAIPVAVLALFALCPALRADELKLKDGTTISGTIVGFEENSFKVKTSYGFAEVQKDQVVSISISDAVKKPDPAVEKPAASAKPAKTESTADTAPAASKLSKTDAKSASAAPANAAPNAGATTATATPPAKTTLAPTPAPVAVAAADPPKAAVPEPMREEVNGNTYTNDTFGFQMYKPPDWQVIAGARQLLPGTITAMGTEDETTYLLIGQE